MFGLKNKARDLASVLMRHWHTERGATGLWKVGHWGLGLHEDKRLVLPYSCTFIHSLQSYPDFSSYQINTSGFR